MLRNIAISHILKIRMAGDEVGFYQSEIPCVRRFEPIDPSGMLQVQKTDTVIRISGMDFVYEMDAHSGQFTKMYYRDKDMITQSPYIDIWHGTQDNGNHVDCEYVSVADVYGVGFLFYTKERFEMSTLHCTSDDLEKAKHTVEVENRKETFVHIDYRHNGVGSQACGHSPRKESLLTEKDISYEFYMTPYLAEDCDIRYRSKCMDK